MERYGIRGRAPLVRPLHPRDRPAHRGERMGRAVEVLLLPDLEGEGARGGGLGDAEDDRVVSPLLHAAEMERALLLRERQTHFDKLAATQWLGLNLSGPGRVPSHHTGCLTTASLPETVAALLEWSVEGRAASVALAPASALLMAR